MANAARRIVFGLMALLWAGCGALHQRGGAHRIGSLDNVQCVAVLPFDNQSDYASAGNIVSDIVSTQLYATRKFKVMERGEILRMLTERNILIPSTMDPTYAKYLGEILGVDAVFIGAVSEFISDSQEGGSRPLDSNPVVSFNSRLVDIRTGALLWSASYLRTSQDVFSLQRDPVTRLTGIAVQDMVRELTRGLGARNIVPGEFCGRGGEELQLVSAKAPVVEDEGTLNRLQLELLRLSKELEQSRRGTGGPQYENLKQEYDKLQEELAVKNLQLKGSLRPDLLALQGDSKDQYVIHFEPGQTGLKTGSFVILDQLGNLLQKYPNNLVIIEGHSDNFGSVNSRFKSATQRALEVQFYFMNRWKIPPDRIFVKGYGDTKPVHANDSPFGRTLNRRVEMVLVEVPKNEQASLVGRPLGL